MSNEKKRLAVRRAWEIYTATSDILAQRISYGMVAQSMLLLSYVTLFVNQERLQKHPVLLLEIGFSFLGMFYSAMEFTRTKITSNRIEKLLKDYLNTDHDPVFKAFWTAYPAENWQHRIRHIYVTALLGIVWLGLLAVAIRESCVNSN